MFGGFPEETVRFFLEIRFHNETSFFNAHRDEYERFVKKPFFDLIETVTPTVEKIADDMEIRPGKCLARIHRDTRFTRDKSPYRDHLWLLFRRSGESRENAATYWFELSPESVSWGLGFWHASRPIMDALRRRIREKPEEIQRIFKQCKLPAPGLDLFGERYKRMVIPTELPQSLQELYPLKDIYCKRTDIPLRAAYTPEIAERFAADMLRLKPLYGLLRQAADEAMAALDA